VVTKEWLQVLKQMIDQNFLSGCHDQWLIDHAMKA